MDKLIQEFEQTVGLSTTEARRSAFIAFATVQGWNNARIGRYLGTTRHRVGQKLDKYRIYMEQGKMPTLTEVLASAGRAVDTTPGRVAFKQSDWEDESFALGILRLVAGIETNSYAN